MSRMKQNQSTEYINIPLVLLAHEKYKDMSFEAKIVYSSLLEKTYLESSKQHWKDSHGRLYVMTPANVIAQEYGFSISNVQSWMNELEQYGLILQANAEMPGRVYVKNFAVVTAAVS